MNMCIVVLPHQYGSSMEVQNGHLKEVWMNDAISRPFQQYFSHIRTMGG